MWWWLTSTFSSIFWSYAQKGSSKPGGVQVAQGPIQYGLDLVEGVPTMTGAVGAR